MTDYSYSHNGYRKLLSYQKAELIHAATVYFCDRFMARKSRHYERMVSSSRSGLQNIIERSSVAGVSREMEITLTTQARLDLENLLAHYINYLTSRKAELWGNDCSEAQFVRRLSIGTSDTPASFETFRPYIEYSSPDEVANVIICLLRQTIYLLDRLVKQLEATFIKDGGLREKVYQVVG